MQLYTYYRSTSSYRVRLALALKGLDYQAMPVNLLANGGQQRTAGYLALNPQGRVPSLVTDEGEVLLQSPAIIEYLEERYPAPALLPVELLARARHRAVAALIGCDVHPLHNVSVLNQLRQLALDETQVGAWIGRWVTEGLQAVEALVGDAGFCFGDLGLADVYLLPQLYAARRFQVDLAPFVRLRRIERLALALPAVQRAHPDAQSDRPS